MIKYNMQCTKIMLIKSIIQENILQIKYFLDNKMQPNEEYIYKYLSNSESSSEIIK